MTSKSLVLGSVLFLFLVSLNGCYTVFRRGSLDGKPPAAISERELGTSSADVAYDNYHNGRWRYYLSCPWWYQSIWFESSQYNDDDYNSDMTPDFTPPAAAPGDQRFQTPGYTPVRQEVPNAAPETRMKDTNTDNNSKPAEAKKEEPAKKPKRRSGGGGR